jgi:hypothetical protein
MLVDEYENYDFITFDPAKNQNELPNVTLRTPDYFL